MHRTAYRAALLHFLADPSKPSARASYLFYPDGLLVVESGRIKAIGPASELLPGLGDTPLVAFADALIVPGFVDTHIHYPQTEMIGAYGKHLLDWLNTYTFPVESRFADPAHATASAGFFINELLRNGTTTALVFASVHTHSTDALFAAANQRQLRMIAGKVLMDRNAPEQLLDTAESGYQDSQQLIAKWHGKGRLAYAVTPRFAPTSTPAQLSLAGQLL